MRSLLRSGLLGLAACSATAPPLEPLEGHRPPLAPVLLGPGSEVEVKFYYTPEIDEIQFVRPDGHITLQLIGDVYVSGRTPEEIRDEIVQRYAGHLKEPEVAVVVRSLADRHVLVGGEVQSPGLVAMPADMTVLEAVMQAGGPDFLKANVENVVVVRHRGGQREGFAVNLRPALQGEDHRPFYLHPQDVVFVPQTRIARLDQWIDQHINQMVPKIGLRYSRPSGRATIGIDTSTR